MNAKTLGELAEAVQGRLDGPKDMLITGISSLNSAGSSEITFALNPRLADAVASSGAGALILPEGWPFEEPRPKIFVKDPYLAYARVAGLFAEKAFEAKGIHPSAVIGQGCKISKQVTIGPGAVIGDRAEIGREVTVHPGAVIGSNVVIGEGSTIFPNVVIYDNCRVGNRVRIHAGAVIGADGFGYAQGEEGHVKIPQAGIVVIEDDVEIGANTTIDRATFGETRIGQGSKIDNLVMIAHNVQVGPGSIIVSQVGISGSTKVGARVMLAGQVGIVGHIDIGDGVRIGAKSGVPSSVPAGETVSGIPAMPHRKWLRMTAAMKKLPEMVKDIKAIKRRLDRLEQ